MPARRFHSKSRHGCLQCKKNRTKCDEIRPKCGRCERVGVDCSLTDQNSDWIFLPNKRQGHQKEETNTELDRSSNSSNQSNVPSNIDSIEDLELMTISTPDVEQSILQPLFTDVERDRLRLMHYYTLHVSKTVAEITMPKGEDRSIWSNWVVELAFEHDFLLHGLLSLSALHLALCGISTQKHTLMALHYHELGAAWFRPHISNVTPENYDAFFAFSYIIILFSFGINRSSDSETNQIARIHQHITLMRGSSAIVKANLARLEKKLEKSRWSVLMSHLDFQSTQELSDEIEDMLSKLLQRVSTTIALAAQKDMYTTTIQTLRDNFIVTTKHAYSQLALALFAVLSPADYWELVSKGEPLALAILANYGVILDWFGQNIWLQGWGRDVISSVHQVLPPEWHECIAWALQETGLA